MQVSSRAARSNTFRAPILHSPRALWRAMLFFNLYRLVLAGLLVFLFDAPGSPFLQNALSPTLFHRGSLLYVAAVLASLGAIWLRKPRFSIQLASQMGADILCVALLSYASSGAQNSLGILLMVTLAAAGLMSRGRITLFYAAVASIAMLLEHSYAVLTNNSDLTQFFQVGLLSMAYFAVAWLSHTLARYAVASEQLASQRGDELASMAEANRLVIQGLADGVLVMDASGAIRQHNPSAERLLGCNLNPPGAATLEQCAPPLAGLFAAWRQDPQRPPETVRLTASGRTVRAHFMPVRRDFKGALLMLEDVQRVQEQAQQIKLAALGRLTASIAHEIRNPLSAISYAVELFQEGSDSANQHKLIGIIMENTARLNGIVHDVMQLNRRDRAQPELLRLGDELRTITEQLCQAERVAPRVIQITAAPDDVIRFDRGHFNQVIWNLCGNALRYCSKYPDSIQLQAGRMDDGRLMLEVIDDGAGIPPEDEGQLFEPFFTTSSSGSGLGLFIARELCEANRASLEYIRREPGGACFRIIFGETVEQ